MFRLSIDFKTMADAVTWVTECIDFGLLPETVEIHEMDALDKKHKSNYLLRNKRVGDD